jgi:hypothetical protein
MEETLSAPSETYLHLYGVVRSKALDLGRISGIEKAKPLFLVHCGELACVVSSVSGTAYEPAHADHVERARSIAARAVHHDEVLRHIHQLTTVVPFKFATLSHGEEHVREILDERKEKFEHLLRLFFEQEEWSVRLSWRRDEVLRQIHDTSPELLTFKENGNGGSPGEQYFVAKKKQKLVEELAAVEAARINSSTSDRLRGLGISLMPLPCKNPAPGAPQIISSIAILADKESLSLVLDGLQGIETLYSAYHVKAELSGPWPPYSFVSLEPFTE